ncbi:MAG: hypothetical protein MUD01_03645 [Chloroflexaceae bacterium]|nr:hypothetical protein [Chloroflexaceae bacterium]
MCFTMCQTGPGAGARKLLRSHGQERARLVARGLTPAFADSQIAAIAVTNQLIFVTFSTADYVNFAGLALEDWRV